MVIDRTLFGDVDKVKIAIDRLQNFEPPEGYYLAFSGGKDSQTIYHLAKEAGVKFDAHFNLTTVDPPELIYFIRENYPEVEVHHPEKSMWDLIPKKLMPPTRMVRYCCDYLKEQGGDNRVVVTGVRKEESSKRSGRRVIENCLKNKGKVFCNPIVDWTEVEVWQYIRSRGLNYCTLYDEGFKRLGCIGCPLAGPYQMEKEFARWPKYKALYIQAFDRMIAERIRRGKDVQWKTGEEVMDWWIHGTYKDKNLVPDQTIMFE